MKPSRALAILGGIADDPEAPSYVRIQAIRAMKFYHSQGADRSREESVQSQARAALARIMEGVGAPENPSLSVTREGKRETRCWPGPCSSPGARGGRCGVCRNRKARGMPRIAS